jgi:hypothetical protein
MKFKKVKKLVPWCEKCKSEIMGNGSGLNPYRCKCGEWKYNRNKNDYVLKINQLKNKE